MDRANLIKYYYLCNVLVLPRPKHIVTDIAFPTKFVEYAAAKKAILTTDVGMQADLVRNYDCGVVTDNVGVKGLNLGIEKLLADSPERLKEMGVSARRMVESEFEWSKIGQRINSAIGNLAR